MTTLEIILILALYVAHGAFTVWQFRNAKPKSTFGEKDFLTALFIFNPIVAIIRAVYGMLSKDVL
jgi:hypothetical protein